MFPVWYTCRTTLHPKTSSNATRRLKGSFASSLKNFYSLFFKVNPSSLPWLFLVLVSIPKLVKYLHPFHKSLVWEKTLRPTHDRTWTPPLLRRFMFSSNFLMYDYRCSSISAGSCAGYSYASKAFIFSLYNVKGYNPVKLTQYQNQQYAMYRCNTRGPTFGGGHDIYISDDSGNSQNSYTSCGYTYTTPSGYLTGDCGFFTGGSHFSPTDVEVFYEAGNQEKHPFPRINT